MAKLAAGLAGNPKNVVTLMANNLACIHAEHGGKPDKDKALALAQMAKTSAAVQRLHAAGMPFLVLLAMLIVRPWGS